MTVTGNWGHWKDLGSGVETEGLTIIGVKLRGAKPWFPGGRAERGSRGWNSYNTKMRRVHSTLDPGKAGSRANAELPARASSAPQKVAPLRAWCHSPGCWATPRPVEPRSEKVRKLAARRLPSRKPQTPDAKAHSLAVTLSKLRLDLGDDHLESASKFNEDLNSTPTPSLSLINDVFKSEALTKAEVKFKNSTMVEMMKLHKQIKQSQVQREPLMEESRQLHTEKFNVQAENKLFLEYLINKTEEHRRQAEILWNNYLQISRDVEQKKEESVSRYTKKIAELKMELLQSEKVQFNLKQQLQTMRGILTLKEKQERQIQTLQEEKRKTHAETDKKIQESLLSLLQEKATLEKQLSEPDMRQFGKRKRKLNSFQAMESAAKQHSSAFNCGIYRENMQLQKELLQLVEQCQKLEDTQIKLNTKKQQLQQEQWYVESIKRGRQRLQRLHNWYPKGQGAPETTVTPPLGTKSRINPK